MKYGSIPLLEMADIGKAIALPDKAQFAVIDIDYGEDLIYTDLEKIDFKGRGHLCLKYNVQTPDSVCEAIINKFGKAGEDKKFLEITTSAANSDEYPKEIYHFLSEHCKKVLPIPIKGKAQIFIEFFRSEIERYYETATCEKAMNLAGTSYDKINEYIKSLDPQNPSYGTVSGSGVPVDLCEFIEGEVENILHQQKVLFNRKSAIDMIYRYLGEGTKEFDESRRKNAANETKDLRGENKELRKAIDELKSQLPGKIRQYVVDSYENNEVKQLKLERERSLAAIDNAKDMITEGMGSQDFLHIYTYQTLIQKANSIGQQSISLKLGVCDKGRQNHEEIHKGTEFILTNLRMSPGETGPDEHVVWYVEKCKGVTKKLVVFESLW